MHHRRYVKEGRKEERKKERKRKKKNYITTFIVEADNDKSWDSCLSGSNKAILFKCSKSVSPSCNMSNTDR